MIAESIKCKRLAGVKRYYHVNYSQVLQPNYKLSHKHLIFVQKIFGLMLVCSFCIYFAGIRHLSSLFEE